MRHSNFRRQGLILLVVLGMLTLFSLLAISYVVFSGQSRSANFSLARRDFHGMKEAEVIDEAMKQILRGTIDNISAVGPHSLLADLYGHSESSSSSMNNLLFQARGSGVLYANRFLQIPLNTSQFTSARGVVVRTQLAREHNEHDAFTGRVLTFLNGPLSGISFRIVRSVAGIPGFTDLQHSLVIDLDEAGPEGASIAANQLCAAGFEMWINARELNGQGYGIPHNFDGETATATLTGASGTPLNLQPGLQPNSDLSGQPPLGQILGGQIGANNTRALMGFSTPPVPSDSDESYDAPDHNDFFLAHTRSPLTIPDPADTSAVGLPGQDIIPSFHRAALVNYIINREDLSDTSNFTQDDFVRLLDDIQGACGRPLGISVVNMAGRVPYFSANPYFDGSNPGSAVSTPVLSIDLGGNWNNWLTGSPSPQEKFLAWARMLTGGPWDVDNDGDGVNDSVWVDIDLPLITSPEGKLLKMMAAYYIEDLDNRLDLNAVGNQVQSTGADFVANSAGEANFNVQGDLPQGFGLGPAESTLRHLFTSDTDWQAFLDRRYGGTPTTFAGGVIHLPGHGTNVAFSDDLRSQLNGAGQAANAPTNSGTRSRRPNVQHNLLPGLPSAPRGDFAMGFDRMGNPLLLRGTFEPDQGTDDPYEARLMSTPHQDLPYTIAEWERVYRHRDWDRSAFPRRLENSPPFAPGVNSIGVVTPRSAHTRHVPLVATSVQAQNDPNVNPQVTTFRELLEAIGQFRRPTQFAIPAEAYDELFPLEFKRAQAMDLNRPFGNGIDDNDNGSIDEPNELLTGSLFNGNNLDLLNAGLQQSPYVVGTAIQRTLVSEFPVLSPLATNPAHFGYSYGNLDPEYEQFVNSGLGSDTAARVVANQYHGQQSRQLMARHLYCLAMLLLPDNLVVANRPTTAEANPPPRILTESDRAHAIAQWVVNIIDFRDADHVMTRFAYDPYPFEKNAASDPYWLPNRARTGNLNSPPTGYVVWGMEQPELLLTETGATHDLRIRDTAEDSSGKKIDSMTGPDTDYDQYRIPQGSLFLELMSPRTTAPADYAYAPGTASSLYSTDGGNRRLLDLGKVTPSDGTTEFPVWRVAISEPHAYPENETTKETPNNIVNGTAESGGALISRHDVSYQLSTDTTEARLNGLVYDRPLASSSRAAVPAPNIDRLLWFVNQNSITDVAAAAVGLPAAIVQNDRPAHVYFNESTTTNPMLAGGQYLVVGPRPTTYFGSKTSASTAHNNEPNDHRIDRIDILSDWAELYVNSGTAGGTLVPRPLTRDIVAMTAVTTPPWNRTGPWTETTTEAYPWVGLNVSEPHPTDTGYYTEPTRQLNSANNTAAANGALGFADLSFDAYYDYSAPGADAHPGSPFDNLPGTPIKEHYEPHHPATGAEPAGVATPGTQLDWCTAFLQRLADPERPYHAAFNPYITVDWMPIDLTVISGEDTIYTDTMKSAEFAAEYKFGFRSKNGSLDASAATKRGRTFLSYLTEAPVENTGSPAAGVYFPEELPVDNTSGSLSVPTVARPTAADENFTTLGYLNSAYELATTPPTDFVGAPNQTPATLQWNNRDFASPYELMLVPLSSPGQLMQDFSAPINAAEITGRNHYLAPEQVNVFSHLPNFFQEAQDPNTPGTGVRQAFTPATLLELVTVPSQWSDADKVIPPSNFDYNDTRQVMLLGPIMPPYNRISQMREPGRVNINTLEDVEVMRGLEWSYLKTADRISPSTSLAFQALKASRDRSYLQPIGTDQIDGNKRNVHLDGNYPTQFPGVFKSALAVGRVAPTRATGALDQLAMQSPAGASLLRINPDPTGTSTFRPLLAPRPELLSDSTNPHTEYLPMSRLANLTTTRSNVFAVRITIGYFEFDPTTGIGPEYGWDNGQSRRHRGFYVIDRSVPVAYESGKDLNTSDCVLVRRIIE